MTVIHFGIRFLLFTIVVSIAFAGCKKEESQPVIPDDEMTFDCENGECSEIVGGGFTSMSACENACSVEEEIVYLNPDVEYGQVTDAQGNTYATVMIGEQEWMAQNLHTTTYSNGDPIPNVMENYDWQVLYQTESGAWSHYNNVNQAQTPLGHLYNWYAVDDDRNICPSGWHVPSSTEWLEMLIYLDAATDTTTIGIQSQIVGGLLKSAGYQYWSEPNIGATNASGFSGLPGGFRYYFGEFNTIGNHGKFWSSTEYFSDAYFFRLDNSQEWVVRTFEDRRTGMSVRCLRD